MDALLIMLRNVILFVALAIPGYLLVKTGILKQEQSGAISKLLMYVGMPFLILSSTIGKLDLGKDFLFLLLAVILLGVVYIFACFVLSKPLTAMEKDKKTQGMMRFCSIFANNGFLGIPLAMAVFGADSPVMTVLIILNIVTNVLLYTLGVYLVSGDKSKMNLKNAILNPVLIAFVIGIVLNLIKITDYIPEVTSYSNHFQGLVTPLSMTILGMKMGELKMRSLFTSSKIYYVSLLRLVLFPATIVALLFALRPLLPSLVDEAMILGFFVAFAMPTAGLASTFADTFDGDTENAVAMTLGTTILSILSIPALYWLICLLL